MSIQTTFFTSTTRRIALSALAVIIACGIPGICETIFPGTEVFAAPNSSAVTTNDPIYRYKWNLTDGDQPLLNLPDRLNAGIDLSLSFSMGEFEFPLMQSLYYNQTAGKYILMLISKHGRQAEFIDLMRGRSFGQPDGPALNFSDDGANKLLSTEDGTRYSFAAMADGQFHCSQIRDHNGVVINLHYNHAARLAQIDSSGRAINFSYSEDYVTAVTQTWGAGASRKQTWAIADTWALVQPVGLSANSHSEKHIPSNATKSGYTTQMAACDLTLAAIFGGPTAVAAANGFEPRQLGHEYPLYRGDLIGDDGALLRGHLSYAMHLYGSADGTGESALYVPAGFTSHSATPTPTDAAVTFYYPRLGQLTDITLAVFHIADFHLTVEGDRVRIGNIGGPGGSAGNYRHAHIEFYRGKTGLPSLAARARLRIDPAIVFEVSREAVARLSTRTLNAGY
ncbi:MAG TPA: hypothetical protein VJT50_00145 [Pyrinomonadaceae bacterium]|nr:hypothetical protein [Pyrinomonadaceae bacterium]